MYSTMNNSNIQNDIGSYGIFVNSQCIQGSQFQKDLEKFMYNYEIFLVQLSELKINNVNTDNNEINLSIDTSNNKSTYVIDFLNTFNDNISVNIKNIIKIGIKIKSGI